MDIKKLRKTIFSYKMMDFSLMELTFSRNLFLSCAEMLASAKVQKGLLLQKNDKKVTLLLFYRIFGV